MNKFYFFILIILLVFLSVIEADTIYFISSNVFSVNGLIPFSSAKHNDISLLKFPTFNIYNLS